MTQSLCRHGSQKKLACCKTRDYNDLYNSTLLVAMATHKPTDSNRWLMYVTHNADKWAWIPHCQTNYFISHRIQSAGYSISGSVQDNQDKIKIS